MEQGGREWRWSPGLMWWSYKLGIGCFRPQYQQPSPKNQRLHNSQKPKPHQWLAIPPLKQIVNPRESLNCFEFFVNVTKQFITEANTQAATIHIVYYILNPWVMRGDDAWKQWDYGALRSSSITPPLSRSHVLAPKYLIFELQFRSVAEWATCVAYD